MDAPHKIFKSIFKAKSNPGFYYFTRQLFHLFVPLLFFSSNDLLFAESSLKAPKLSLLWDSIEIENIHVDLIKELRLKFPGINFKHFLHTSFLNPQKTKIRTNQKILAILKQTFNPLDELGWIWNDPSAQTSFWNPDKVYASICDGITPCFEDHSPSSNSESYYSEQLKYYEDKISKFELKKPREILNPTGLWDQAFLKSANKLGYNLFTFPYFGKQLLKRINYSKIWNQNMAPITNFVKINSSKTCQLQEAEERNSTQENLANSIDCRISYLLDSTFQEDDKIVFKEDREALPVIMVRVSSLPFQFNRLSKIIKIIENICTKSKQCEKFASL